jgi:hypothetical protein
MQIAGGKEFRVWEKDYGACIRVLKCHSSRAKKISTENSPDVFLTAAEDGEVRQTDLRVPVSDMKRGKESFLNDSADQGEYNSILVLVLKHMDRVALDLLCNSKWNSILFLCLSWNHGCLQ